MEVFWATPLVGWRFWKIGWSGGRILLRSFTLKKWPGEEVFWPLGEALRAQCYHFAHEAPNPTCTCGIYATRTVENLLEYGFTHGDIIGQVSLWGKIVEHAWGYRAEFAYPRALWVPGDCAIAGEVIPVSKMIRNLGRYGVEVYHTYPPEVIEWHIAM